MNSRERCLSAIENKPVDYVPCSFMLFFNLYNTCKSDRATKGMDLERNIRSSVVPRFESPIGRPHSKILNLKSSICPIRFSFRFSKNE